MTMKRNMIVDWLRTGDPARLEKLWLWADETRRCFVGDEVHLRGLLEISNTCVRQCHYCGLRADNARVRRYRMTEGEILACARQAVEFGYGTVVLQAGEDPGIEADWMAGVIRRIKGETPLAVTLSLGERRDDEFALWREAGADRYLLRFETSNRSLYESIHPPLRGRRSDRFAMLRTLKGLGYEIGSGIMVESCTHHPVEEDIGRENIPRWLQHYVGGPLQFTHVQGHDFPDDMSPYHLVVQCGACMGNRREMLSRIARCRSAGVPISNYGLTIACSLGILPRALGPFPEAQEAYRQYIAEKFTWENRRRAS